MLLLGPMPGMQQRCSWRMAWQPTPISLPGESHGRGSLAGCSPQRRTESDTTEVTWHDQVLTKQTTEVDSLLSSGLIQ